MSVKQLTDVDVDTAENGDVRVTWTLAKALPRTGTALLSVFITSGGDHLIRRQIGYKVLDGVQIACFVFDYDRGFQDNLVGAADEYSGGPIAERVRVVVPARLMGGLSDWGWRSVLNLDGVDVEHWPGAV